MYTAIVLVFIVGYIFIAFEHPLHINKSATALITGVICWTLFALAGEFPAGSENIPEAVLEMSKDWSHFVGEELAHHLSEISQILFFLIGAMTIVELVDIHQGFRVITDRITTKSRRKLLWIICLVTFILSALLDNLTTSIVMVSLLTKLIEYKRERLIFAGMIVIAANSGGAWSPIGDVTTTMLWIDGQITTPAVVLELIIPSLVSMIVPLGILTMFIKGEVRSPDNNQYSGEKIPVNERTLVFFLGVAGLVFVPIYKIAFHLPPYMGMMLSLGVLWVITEILHRKKTDKFKSELSASHALEKIDIPSVLFFLGILLAVSTLQSTRQLHHLADWLTDVVGNQTAIIGTIGMLSAIVDNVPLVKAAQGMYDMAVFPTDHPLWLFLAYCAGTGGSVLIIGSAAGVAVMGIERIEFMWYMKKIGWLALIGYLAGAVTYVLMFGWI